MLSVSLGGGKKFQDSLWISISSYERKKITSKKYHRLLTHRSWLRNLKLKTAKTTRLLFRLAGFEPSSTNRGKRSNEQIKQTHTDAQTSRQERKLQELIRFADFCRTQIYSNLVKLRYSWFVDNSALEANLSLLIFVWAFSPLGSVYGLSTTPPKLYNKIFLVQLSIWRNWLYSKFACNITLVITLLEQQ